jgi:hypothetical protein
MGRSLFLCRTRWYSTVPNLLTSYLSFERGHVNRYYNTLHKEKYDKYEGATRFPMLYDLKSKLSKQKKLFLKSATNERENLMASYEVRLELVKQKNSFRDGELIKHF